MAENPVRRFARLLGGVVLMQGGLGHQVLGQLLVADVGDAVLAGAMMVITGTARQRNIVAQAALRTAAPSLAAQWFLRSKESQLQRREAGYADREIKRQRIEILKAVIQHRSGRRLTALERGTGVVVLTPPPVLAATPELAALRKNHERLRARMKRLSSARRALAALPLVSAPAVEHRRHRAPKTTVAKRAKAIRQPAAKASPKKSPPRRATKRRKKGRKRRDS